MFKVLENSTAPTRGSKYSACVDLYASENIIISVGETKLIGLGVCVDLEMLIDRMIERSHGMWIEEELIEQRMFLKKSHYFQLMLRSSLGKKGLMIPNGVGIIDLDYKDEIKMMIHNPITLKNILPFVYKTIKNYFKVIANIDKPPIEDDNGYKIKKGDKIAQITLLEHKSYLFDIESDVERDGGFGSTGE